MESPLNLQFNLGSRWRTPADEAQAPQDHGRKLFTLFAVALAALSLPIVALGQGVLTTQNDTSQNQFVIQYMPYNAYPNSFQMIGSASTQETGIGSRPTVGGDSPFRVVRNYNCIYSADEIFYVTNSLHIEQLWGSTGSPTDLTVLTGAEPAATNSALVAYCDLTADTDNVFYIGQDQHVHLLTWSPSPGWTTADLTKLSGATAVLAGSGRLTGHMKTSTNKSEEVFFIDANNDVHEIWRWSATFDGWHNTNLYSATSPPSVPPIAGSSLAHFYDAVANLDKVVYVGTDQDVHAYIFPATAIWTNTNLTTTAGAAPVGGNVLTAHENTIANSEEVFFVDSSSNIEELWAWSSAPTVWYRTPSLVAGAPSVYPSSVIVADVNSANGTDDVYYVSNSSIFYQLSWTPWSLTQLVVPGTYTYPPINN